MEATEFYERADTAGLVYSGTESCHLIKTYDESDSLPVLEANLPALLGLANSLSAWVWIGQLVVLRAELLRFQQREDQRQRLSWHSRPVGYEADGFISLKDYVRQLQGGQ